MNKELVRSVRGCKSLIISMVTVNPIMMSNVGLWKNDGKIIIFPRVDNFDTKISIESFPVRSRTVLTHKCYFRDIVINVKRSFISEYSINLPYELMSDSKDCRFF